MSYFSIPRSGLVGEFLLDANANDTNDGTKATVTPTNLSYGDCPAGYQKQWGVFNGSNAGVTSTNYNTTALGANFHFAFYGTVDSLAKIDKYLFMRGTGTNQNAILCGYVAGQFEFFSNGGHTGTDPRAGSGLTIPDTTKPHLYEYRYDGTTWSGYVDGVQAFSTARTFSLTTTSANIYLGRSDGGNYFPGKLGAFRVWNRALTDNERLSLWHEFNRKLGGGSDFGAVIPAPAYQWDFMGDAVDVASSVSPVANSGTFAGTDYFGITKGVTYNGSSQKTDIASVTGINEFTWVNRFKTTTSSLGAIFDATGSGTPTIYSYVNLVGAGKFRFQYFPSGSTYRVVESTSNVNDGNWHTAIVTGDGTANGTKLYIDGALEATDVSGQTATLGGATFSNSGFGYRRYSSNNWLACSISDTIIFPGAFTASQVTYLTNSLKRSYPYAFRRSIPSSLSNGLLFRCGAFNGSTMYDESGNGYNFTGTATKVRAGQLDAGSFSNQLLTLTRAAGNEPTVGSLSIWMKTTNNTYNCVLVGKDNVVNTDRYGPLLWLYTDGRVVIEVSSSTSYTQLFSVRTVNDGKWHRITGTWDGSTMKVYIDGALDASTTQSYPCQYNSNDWKVGGDSSNGTRYFPGNLAYPTLWNRALNSYDVMMDRYSTYIQ